MSLNYHAKNGLVFGKGIPTQHLFGALMRAGRRLVAPEAQNPHQVTTTSNFPLGTKMDLGDRIFRYGRAGATTVVGTLYESAAKGGAVLSTNEGLTSDTIDTPAGGTTITFTLKNDGATDSVTANQYKDGYITIAASTAATDGRGQTFKIKSHPAAARNADVVFTLYDGVPVEIDSSESVTVSIVKNIYDNVIQSPAGAMTGTPAGVPPVIIASASYGWFQTRGPCGVLLDSDVVAGAPLGPDASVAGAITTQVVNAGYLLIPTVANAIADADTGEWAIVNLCID